MDATENQHRDPEGRPSDAPNWSGNPTDLPDDLLQARDTALALHLAGLFKTYDPLTGLFKTANPPGVAVHIAAVARVAVLNETALRAEAARVTKSLDELVDLSARNGGQ